MAVLVQVWKVTRFSWEKYVISYRVVCQHIYGRLLGEKRKEDSSADR